MNLRNILISAVALGSLLCTSCSNELADIPEKQPETGLTEGITITLIAEAVQTRAGSDVSLPYSYATTDELQINRVHLAFFELDGSGIPTSRIHQENATFTAPNTTVNDSSAYRISGISLPVEGQTVRVLAIANSALDLSGLTTYADYRSAIESQASVTFTATNLVKAGFTDYRFTTNNVSVVVPLTQLTARVDLYLDINIPSTSLAGIDSTWLFSAADMMASGTKGEEVPGVMTKIKIQNNSHNYTYKGKPIHIQPDGNAISLTYLVNNTKYLFSGKSVWRLYVSKMNINQIEKQSFLLLDNRINPDGQQANLTAISEEMRFNSGEKLFSFYSYEKSYTTASPLEVELDAYLIQQQMGTHYETQSGQWLALYLIENNNSWTAASAWKSDKGELCLLPYENVTTTSATNQGIKWGDTTAGIEKATRFILNPVKQGACTTDGLIHGNLYRATLSYSPAAEIWIDYISNPFAPVTVNIPSFD